MPGVGRGGTMAGVSEEATVGVGVGDTMVWVDIEGTIFEVGIRGWG